MCLTCTIYMLARDRVDVVGYVDSFIDKNNQLKVFVHASHCEFRERKKDPDPDSRNEYTQDYDWPDDNLDEIEDSDIPF